MALNERKNAFFIVLLFNLKGNTAVFLSLLLSPPVVYTHTRTRAHAHTHRQSLPLCKLSDMAILLHLRHPNPLLRLSPPPHLEHQHKVREAATHTFRSTVMLRRVSRPQHYFTSAGSRQLLSRPFWGHNILGTQGLSVVCSWDPANCEKGVTVGSSGQRGWWLCCGSGEGADGSLLRPHWGLAEPRFFLWKKKKKTQAPNGSSGEQWGMFDASYICLNIVLTDGFE